VRLSLEAPDPADCRHSSDQAPYNHPHPPERPRLSAATGVPPPSTHPTTTPAAPRSSSTMTMSAKANERVHDKYAQSSKLAKYPFEPYWPERKLKICVTGSGGFIGSHLARRLKSEGHYIVACDWKRNEHFSVRDTGRVGCMHVSTLPAGRMAPAWLARAPPPRPPPSLTS
jgi:hypothetical protein